MLMRFWGTFGNTRDFGQQRRVAKVVTRARPVTGSKKRTKTIPIQIKTVDRTARRQRLATVFQVYDLSQGIFWPYNTWSLRIFHRVETGLYSTRHFSRTRTVGYREGRKRNDS